VSFSIQQNQVVALVGYTGSGKTTITNLLTRFWDPQKGRKSPWVGDRTPGLYDLQSLQAAPCSRSSKT
jgi:ABC-type branched-subunit amino acid transport system ATPase component